PTHSEKRDAGMIFAFRNGFTFTRYVSRGFNFLLIETPILHMYKSSSAEGSGQANPLFENRIDAGFNIALTSRFSASFLVNYYLTLKRSLGEGSDRWAHHIGFMPKLTYAPSSNLNFSLLFDT